MNGRTWTVAVICTVLLLTSFATYSPTVTLAKGRVPDTIRVALFIDIGKFYRGTEASVSLTAAPRTALSTSAKPVADASASKALTIGERTPLGAIVPWFTVQGTTTQQFAMDQFMVALLETERWSEAKALSDKMTGTTTDKPHIDMVYRKGKAMFRVLAGMYATRSDAQTARNRLLSSTRLKPLIKADDVYLVGNKRLLTGTYPKESDALAQMQLLRMRGLHPAMNLIADSKGVLTYVISVGEATDDAELEKVKSEALKAFPSLLLIIKPLDWSGRTYLHKKEAVLPAGDSYVTSGLYFFNPVGQRVVVSAAQDGIRVDERGSRIYRGTFELLRHNGVLTLINVLPFETYLCSVVGAEMGSLFPDDALRAQAIIARTYAAAQGLKYQIAHVSDTTFDQAYMGVGSEAPKVTAAVKFTEDMLLTYKNELISAVYFSNAGGVTAEPDEVWGGDRPYFKSVSSPDETGIRDRSIWYRVATSDNQIGYVHESHLTDNGQKNTLGLRYMSVKTNNIAVRPMPSSSPTDNAPVDTLKSGERVTVISQSMGSNSYQWIEGPYSAAMMLETINAKASKKISGPLLTLEVTKRGASGRAMEVKANNQVVGVRSPDSYRTVMGGLRSTLFDIEQTGSYTVMGTGGNKVRYPDSKQPLYVLQGNQVANGQQTEVVALSSSAFVIVDGNLSLRVATKDARFRFLGKGFGHGLGLSQWGAMGLAEKGLNYEQILKHYYTGVSVTKE